MYQHQLGACPRSRGGTERDRSVGAGLSSRATAPLHPCVPGTVTGKFGKARAVPSADLEELKCELHERALVPAAGARLAETASITG